MTAFDRPSVEVMSQTPPTMSPTQRLTFLGRATGRAGWILTLVGAVLFGVLLAAGGPSSDGPTIGVIFVLVGLATVVVGKVMRTRATMRRGRAVKAAYDAQRR